DLNRVYTGSPALWSGDDDPRGFQWIDANDAGRSVYSFIRRGDGPDLVSVSNFRDHPHEGFRLGLPAAGTWQEVLNTDSATYTGSGVGNLGSVIAVEGEHGGQPAHADLVLPPLATLWLQHVPA
ncbi:MAG: alpha amylase C-terminal domain-containing protein, partial [Nocardioides sp.]|nr:alpha amylase C-terminal domain-containing protein [Nocardioides sp.]